SRGALSGVRGAVAKLLWRFSASWWLVQRGVHARRVFGAWVRRQCGASCVLRALRLLGGHIVTRDEPIKYVYRSISFTGTVCTVEVCVVFLDTLTPVFELHGPAAVWSADVVLVGLHCSLALLCGCGAAVGPFVLDCETER
ncbi:hypothetical protein Taro_044116, partial [Colocasia esculenta]|nr:hypothetical protein [Colocasia esculenta]